MLNHKIEYAGEGIELTTSPSRADLATPTPPNFNIGRGVVTRRSYCCYLNVLILKALEVRYHPHLTPKDIK